jgi:lysophospholipase L1-like esterase
LRSALAAVVVLTALVLVPQQRASADASYLGTVTGASVVDGSTYNVQTIPTGAHGLAFGPGIDDNGGLLYIRQKDGVSSFPQFEIAGATPGGSVAALSPRLNFGNYTLATDPATGDLFVPLNDLTSDDGGLERVTRDGTVVWKAATCPDADVDGAYTLMPLADGSLGFVTAPCNDPYQYAFRKIDPSTGATVWERTATELGLSFVTTVAPFDGGVVLTDHDKFVFLDLAGNVLGTQSDVESGSYSTGYSHAGRLWRLWLGDVFTPRPSNGCRVATLLSVTAAQLARFADFDLSLDFCPNELQTLPDGSAVVIGLADRPGGGTDVALARVATDGDVVWQGRVPLDNIHSSFGEIPTLGVDSAGRLLLRPATGLPCSSDSTNSCWGARYIVIDGYSGDVVVTHDVQTDVPTTTTPVIGSPNATFAGGRVYDLAGNNTLLSVPVPELAKRYPESRYAVGQPFSDGSLTLTVSPTSGPTGTSFGFSYRCRGANQLSIVDSLGNSVTSGVSIDLPVSSNGTDYTQAATINVPGTYKGRIACGSATADSAVITVSGRKYVALGDSYSAGEGVDPYFRDGFDLTTDVQTGRVDNRCHRSTRAYAEYITPSWATKSFYQLASGNVDPGTSRRNLNKYGSDMNIRATSDATWDFLACSGATTWNVLPTSQGGYPQSETGGYREIHTQLDYPYVDNKAALITITIGGNDIGFADFLRTCGMSSCYTAANEAMIRQRITDLEPQLVKTYQAIQAKAPGARLLAVGYPNLFPETLLEQSCRGLTLFGGEQDFLRAMGDLLNDAVASAAQEVGAEYVDVRPIFAGHEVCGSQGGWLNGVSFTGKIFNPLTGKFVKRLDDESFHPNEFGQRLGYAAAIQAFLAAHPAP